MKKITMLFLTLMASTMTIAQVSTKQKEAGLLFRDFDSFGLTYKTGTGTALWRFNTTVLSGGISSRSREDAQLLSNSLSLNLRGGREYRKNVAEKLEFRYGADLLFGVNWSRFEDNDKVNDDNDVTNERMLYTPGIGAVVGFNYVFSNTIVLGVEVLPTISYTTGKETMKDDGITIETDIEQLNFGFSNTSVLFNLSYRFK